MARVWFVTGSSRGLGREWVTAALERGDRVVATARDVETLRPLVDRFGEAVYPIELDVTDRGAVVAATNATVERFGRLDVVINNAGRGHFGFAEEVTEEEARSQMEVNFFGLVWVTQAAIPLLRKQGSGHLLYVSSVSGVVGTPSLSLYSASKFAVEGFAESVATEMAPFGIKTTIIEPGGYATDWATSSASHSQPLPVYEAMRDSAAAYMADMPPFPSPTATVPAVLAAVDAEHPPLRLALSSMAFDQIVAASEQRIDIWRSWEPTSRSSDHSQSGKK